MIENRELGLEDYLAVLRRPRTALLIPLLFAPLGGFLASYAFPARYTSQSLVLIEDQTVPAGYVKPVITEDITQRIATMQQEVLSRKSLQPMVQRLGLVKKGKTMEDVIGDIRSNLDIEPVQPAGSPGSTSSPAPTSSSTKKKPVPNSTNSNDIPGFTISFTATRARDAQLICGELTSLLLAENITAREQVAQSTTDFLSRQVEEGKRSLDEQDGKLAQFKREHMGQLPGDAEDNLKLLGSLNSQLDANTQTLNRAQQDKTYSESLLAQALTAWRASQASENPQTLEQELTRLQSQLVVLQSRYTDDYPDVAKTKRDIADLKRKLKEINSAAPAPAGDIAKSSLEEPAEIRQMRVQIHQYEDVITQATRTQKRLQDQIGQYESRVSLSPSVEEEYKALTRDYESAQNSYNDLLAKKAQAEVQTDMERNQQGEQLRLLNAAGLPDTPTFPVWWMLTLGGLGAGLGVGLVIAVLLEFQDKTLRDEKDISAALELPTLVSVPWVVAETEGHGMGRFWRPKAAVEA